MREVFDLSPQMVAEYDYDPYGRREVLWETVAFDWGFTGHYYHAESGLHLAPFRAYSADLGRWLSRDPLGEAGGINLYEYALSNPVNFVDPYGLSPGWDFFGGVLDGLTFGLSTMAFGSSFNQCSRAFAAGVWAGFGGSLLLTGVAGGVGFIAARALMKGGLKKLARSVAANSGRRVPAAGQDLYVGLYGQSRRANILSGLNATHTPHRVVQNAVSRTSHNLGVTINIRKDLHVLTRTFGRKADLGSNVKNLAADVRDLRRVLRDAGYDRSLVNQQMRRLIQLNHQVGNIP